MEGILGAFLAGAGVETRSSDTPLVDESLEFVGMCFYLLPDWLWELHHAIHVIFGHGDALKVAGVMIVVALTGKWIACWLTQKIYKMGAIERELMYGLSNAQAAATRSWLDITSSCLW